MKKLISLIAFSLLISGIATAEPVYEKSSGSVLRVSETKEVVRSYDMTELKGRKAQVEEQLAEVNALIDEANKLGIVEEVRSE